MFVALVATLAAFIIGLIDDRIALFPTLRVGLLTNLNDLKHYVRSHRCKSWHFANHLPPNQGKFPLIRLVIEPAFKPPVTADAAQTKRVLTIKLAGTYRHSH
jgi:hypothetical protein